LINQFSTDNMAIRLIVLICLYSTGLIIPTTSNVISGRSDPDEIVFELYTRQNPVDPQLLKLGDLVALQESNYNHSLPTKIFAHGWNADAVSGYSARNQYLIREDCNFISTDWSVLAAGIDYPFIALIHVPMAGQHVAAFVDFLIDNGTPIENFHLMGHSLGSHVVGNAGAAVQSGQLERITGLDPAWPFYTLNNTENRLDDTDARFVDIIHTDGGLLTVGGLAFLPPIGHADFYPNGGQTQPGCSPLRTLEQPTSGDETKLGCDHSRAVSYYAESITSTAGFRAIKCETYEEFQSGSCEENEAQFMGEPTPSTTRGIFYLETNAASPFAMG